MPPKRPLADAEVAALADWVKIGAPDPRRPDSTAPRRPGPIDLEKARRFWSFRPVADPPVPPVRDAAWPLTPVDRFVLAKLEAKGLRPAPPADRRTLIRRATFDLTGLPPTPEEVDAFLADDVAGCVRPGRRSAARVAALRRALGPALARPGPLRRHLRLRRRLPRPAPPTSTATTSSTPSTRDKPYDQFLREQIAGDLLPARPTGRAGPSRSSRRATWRSAAGSGRCRTNST